MRIITVPPLRKKQKGISDFYCPSCGHFVMKHSLQSGSGEVKCQGCKVWIRFSMKGGASIVTLPDRESVSRPKKTT